MQFNPGPLLPDWIPSTSDDMASSSTQYGPAVGIVVVVAFVLLRMFRSFSSPRSSPDSSSSASSASPYQDVPYYPNVGTGAIFSAGPATSTHGRVP